MRKKRSETNLVVWLEEFVVSLAKAILRTPLGQALAILAVLAFVVSALTSGISPQYPTVHMTVWLVLYVAGVWGIYTLHVRVYVPWRDNVRDRGRIKVFHFNELLALSPAQFEHAVADLLHPIGYRNMERIGRSGDLCADLKGYDLDGRSVVVQCKRYAPGNKVGTPDIQTFIGMMTVHHNADNGIFVTTSTFTEPAADLARRHRLKLIDGAGLASIILDAKTRSNEAPVAIRAPMWIRSARG